SSDLGSVAPGPLVELAFQVLGHVLGGVDVVAEHDGVVALVQQVLEVCDQGPESGVLGRALQDLGAFGQAQQRVFVAFLVGLGAGCGVDALQLVGVDQVTGQRGTELIGFLGVLGDGCDRAGGQGLGGSTRG